MAGLKYSNRIITTAKPLPQEVQDQLEEDRKMGRSTIESTHLLTVGGDILEDFFHVDCIWIWSGATQVPIEDCHTHDHAEVMGFIGSNRDDPQDLGGEIVIWLDGRQEVLTKSCLIYVPAGVKHCPILFKRIERPVFFVVISPAPYDTLNVVEDPTDSSNNDTPPRYTIISETKQQFGVGASGEATPPPPPRDPSLKSARILHMEDDMASGSFYVDFVWIYEGNGQAPAPEHTHDWPELIAMVGADPETPRHLGGQMSIVLGDETHVIEKSSLVCIPKGLKHCPWKFIDIKKPTLVFTAGPSAMYTGSHKKD